MRTNIRCSHKTITYSRSAIVLPHDLPGPGQVYPPSCLCTERIYWAPAPAQIPRSFVSERSMVGLLQLREWSRSGDSVCLTALSLIDRKSGVEFIKARDARYFIIQCFDLCKLSECVGQLFNIKYPKTIAPHRGIPLMTSPTKINPSTLRKEGLHFDGVTSILDNHLSSVPSFRVFFSL